MPNGETDPTRRDDKLDMGAVLPETQDEYPSPREYKDPQDPAEMLRQRLLARVRQMLVDGDVETPAGLHLHWDGPALVIEGRVSSAQTKHDVENFVRGINGVQNVDNRLMVFR